MAEWFIILLDLSRSNAHDMIIKHSRVGLVYKISAFLRSFKDSIRFPRIENRVPRIRKLSSDPQNQRKSGLQNQSNEVPTGYRSILGRPDEMALVNLETYYSSQISVKVIMFFGIHQVSYKKNWLCPRNGSLYLLLQLHNQTYLTLIHVHFFTCFMSSFAYSL